MGLFIRGHNLFLHIMPLSHQIPKIRGALRRSCEFISVLSEPFRFSSGFDSSVRRLVKHHTVKERLFCLLSISSFG